MIRPPQAVYALLADFVLGLHMGFVAFVVAGGALLSRRPWLAWLHLPAMLWGALIEFRHGDCPLTPLENQLRQAAGQAGYAGDFVAHYLIAALYPQGLTPEIQTGLGMIVVGVNLGFYGRAWRARRRRG